MEAFFPAMRLRYDDFGGVFEEKDGKIVIVGDSGRLYESLEAFYAEECGQTQENSWEVCEFWKSWSWWKCKEMLPPH